MGVGALGGLPSRSPGVVPANAGSASGRPLKCAVSERAETKRPRKQATCEVVAGLTSVLNSSHSELTRLPAGSPAHGRGSSDPGCAAGAASPVDPAGCASPATWGTG